jgi:hypothetical protein
MNIQEMKKERELTTMIKRQKGKILVLVMHRHNQIGIGVEGRKKPY